ncbi:MAG: aminoacyl-tRNA hydrolase [Candidatus Chisholmbacteria bacterium]|nr:aminoacyl-tRNA hydrolase [Candidatus Chisholmbacteria bacterium]
MKLVVGLGNPGEKYGITRHNLGFLLVDTLAGRKNQFKLVRKFNSLICKLKTENCELLLAKPQTFMNRSGEAVRKLVNSYQLQVDSLYVVHDDLDIKLGEYKIQKGKGPKVHRGILSVEQSLGRSDFWRVRVGVDNRQATSDKRQVTSGDEYVLSKFPKDERLIIDRVISSVVERLWEVLNR